MRMPGFTAEASLYRTNERYSPTTARGDRGADAVRPAGPLDIIFDPCSYCFSTCARNLRLPTSGRDCLNACRFAGLC